MRPAGYGTLYGSGSRYGVTFAAYTDGPFEPEVLGGPTMRFLVLSRERVARVMPNVPYLVISITDPDKPPAAIARNPLCMGLLRLAFDDLDTEITGLVAPAQHHADEIARFVREHLSQVDLIVTQCEAGISRSSGIAAALSRWLNGDDDEFFQRYIPNRRIYRLIRRALGDDAVMLPRD